MLYLSSTPACSLFSWTDDLDDVFHKAKSALAEATLLSNPKPHARTAVMSNASYIAVGAALQQFIHYLWKPIAYFSHKYFVEVRTFSVYADHKPLTKSDKQSPHQCPHLNFKTQFTTDIRYIHGPLNLVADALSRIKLNQLSSLDTTSVINCEDMALAQGDCQFYSEETPILS
uniref:Reverse transcriptase/retrotransposon-derived protein RNase H-like domain-containing protein n=1 Tax=Amphimedon queenslandica TaxID=400682 RepID=A0A1X7VA77_AMPQE